MDHGEVGCMFDYMGKLWLWLTTNVWKVGWVLCMNYVQGLVGFSATLSALGLLLTRLCTNSRIIYGMAQVEMVCLNFNILFYPCVYK